MDKVKTLLVYNMKKDKGAYVALGIVILLAAIMLNLALVLVFQVDKAYDSRFEALNTATINICIPRIQDSNTLTEQIKSLEGVSEVEGRDAIILDVVVKDFRDTDFSMKTVFYNKDELRDMNKLDIKEESLEVTMKNTIYLPLYVASFGEFKLGEEIVYEIGDRKHTFVVSGVLEEMQYGNYGKGLMGAYLPESIYEEFVSEYKDYVVKEYSISATENTDVNALNNDIGELLEQKSITLLTSCDKVSTKDTRTMVCNLMILILITFAFVIFQVSVFLCKFRISNSIEEDMRNMGVLKSLGYTGNMIIGSVIFPYVIVTLISSIIGVIASYGILPSVSELLTLQAGFSFRLVFDIKGLFYVVSMLVCIVAVFTYVSAKRIRKLQPINAMRGNGGGKIRKIFPNGKENVLLFFVSFALTILISFASTLFYNVIVEPNNFISTISEETPEIIVYPKEEVEDDFFKDLKNDARIKTVLKYTMGTLNIDDIPVTVFVCEDFSRVSNDLCYLGDNPDEKNEITLGSEFDGKYKIGEQIEVQNGDISCSYEIKGFMQSVNYQGKVCELTLDGYAALNAESITPSLYLYLENGIDVEEYMKELEEDYGEMIANQVNCYKMTKTTQEMYSGITSILVMVIFALTILIALFVLYVVIKTILVQRKQELGIYKAIGYSNWQLTVQLLGSVLPSSVLAILVSSGLGLLYLPQINQYIFQTIGAMKNNVEVSFTFLMIFALIQIIVNVILSVSLTKPIKKISAYALIKED